MPLLDSLRAFRSVRNALWTTASSPLISDNASREANIYVRL